MGPLDTTQQDQAKTPLQGNTVPRSDSLSATDLSTLKPPPVTSLTNAELLTAWRETILSDRLKSENLRHISDQTANNYYRYVNQFLTAAESRYPPVTTLKESEILGVLGEYFHSVERQNAATGRAVRSALTARFLPWCVEHSHLQLSLESIACFNPVPLHLYSSILVRAFIKDSSNLHCTASETHRFMCSLHYWVATRHLGFSKNTMTHDCRELLSREASFASWIVNGCVSQVGLTTGAPVNGATLTVGPSEFLLLNTESITPFSRSRNNPLSPEMAVTMTGDYTEWLSQLVSKSTPPNSHIENAIRSMTAALTIPVYPPPSPVDLRKAKPSTAKSQQKLARRTEFSRILSEEITLRDSAVDYLVKELQLSLSDAIQLRPEQLSPDALKACSRYAALRASALQELQVAPEPPFLISSDGGSLIVMEDPIRGRATITAQKLVEKATILITALLQKEGLSFSTVKTMSTTELQSLTLKNTESIALRRAYLSAAQVSDLQFSILQREGPSIAFPAVDGEALTADAF